MNGEIYVTMNILNHSKIQIKVQSHAPIKGFPLTQSDVKIIILMKISVDIKALSSSMHDIVVAN